MVNLNQPVPREAVKQLFIMAFLKIQRVIGIFCKGAVIDRILDIRQAAAMKAGGQGDRYTVRIRGKQSYLFFERSTNLTGNNIGRWFVERKVAPPQPAGWVDYIDGTGGRIYSDGSMRKNTR